MSLLLSELEVYVDIFDMAIGMILFSVLAILYLWPYALVMLILYMLWLMLEWLLILHLILV